MSTEPMPQRHIEIVHESLLTKWPRLVHWQAQDSEGAQLRDELRRAARVWDEHDRADDFLWSGTAYREFQLWRERYSGGLTALEEAFAREMTARARRRIRRQRIATAAAIVVLVAAVISFSGLWRQASRAKRAEKASRLLALGEIELAQDPTTAVAYALASLETEDTQAGRVFAVRALSQGPPGRIMQDSGRPVSLSFNASGSLMASGGFFGVEVHEQNGKVFSKVEQGVTSPFFPRAVAFTPNDDLIVRSGGDRKTIKVWSVPARRQLRSFEMGAPSNIEVRANALYILTPATKGAEHGMVRRWRFDSRAPEDIGMWDIPSLSDFALDHTGLRFLYVHRGRVYVKSLEQRSGDAPSLRRITGDDYRASGIWADPWCARFATSKEGGVSVWSVSANQRPRWIFSPRSPGSVSNVAFDPTGARIAVSYEGEHRGFLVWNIDGPENAEPLALPKQTSRLDWPFPIAFTPDGKWLVVWAGSENTEGGTVFYPLTHDYPFTLRGAGDVASAVEFTDDGELLCAFQGGPINVWNLTTGARRSFSKQDLGLVFSVAFQPGARKFLTSVQTNSKSGRYLVSLDDGSATRIDEGPSDHPNYANYCAFSPDGKRAAWCRTVTSEANRADLGIRILDVPAGRVAVIPQSRGERHIGTTFTRDGALYSARVREHSVTAYDIPIFRWDLHTGHRAVVANVRMNAFGDFAVSSNGQFIAAVDCLGPKCGRAVLRMFDVRRGTSRVLAGHGDRVRRVRIDSTRGIVVTGSSDGIVRVGHLNGDEPHLLFGHKGALAAVAIDPNGRWIAAGADSEPVVRLWRMPDLSKPPLQTLPHADLVSKLKSLTNVRIVADPASPTGYKRDLAPFPGWANPVEW